MLPNSKRRKKFKRKLLLKKLAPSVKEIRLIGKYLGNSYYMLIIRFCTKISRANNKVP